MIIFCANAGFCYFSRFVVMLMLFWFVMFAYPSVAALSIHCIHQKIKYLSSNVIKETSENKGRMYKEFSLSK